MLNGDMVTLVVACAALAGMAKLIHWLDVRRESLDVELHKLEREALDSTVRWAYTRGYLDATLGHELTEDSPKLAVQDFRLQWGDERREVWR